MQRADLGVGRTLRDTFRRCTGARADHGDGRFDVIQKVTPAVVAIATWKLRPPANAGDTPRRVKTAGSGFIIDPTGVIVTNKHVIDGALNIMVLFSDGGSVRATLVAVAAFVDLAVLKVDVDGCRCRLAVLAYSSLGVADELRQEVDEKSPGRRGAFFSSACRSGQYARSTRLPSNAIQRPRQR